MWRAYLYGKTIGERAHALTQLAHPNHLEKLENDFLKSHNRF